MFQWPPLTPGPGSELPKHNEDMLTLKLAVEKADNLAQHAKKAGSWLEVWGDFVRRVGGCMVASASVGFFFEEMGHFGNQKKWSNCSKVVNFEAG